MRLALIGIAVASLSLSACLVEHHPANAEEIAEGEAPPPDQVEVIPVSPGPEYVWVRGHWGWRGAHYVWIGGRWGVPPRAHAAWVPGHWRHGRHHYYWVDGHWA